MKRITTLLFIAIYCFTAFAQTNSKTVELSRKAPENTQLKGKMLNSLDTKEAFWSNDFSQPDDWEIAAEPGSDGAVWIITTHEEAPDGWLPVYGMSETFTSTTVDNGFAVFNSDIQGADGGDLQNTYIRYKESVDLSSLEGTPRFSMETYYRRWKDVVYFEYSTDDGTTWEQIELFPLIAQGEGTANGQVYSINVPELIGETNVLFGFRVTGDWDYGWYIDDLKIIDAPDYDLIFLDSRMSFVDYVDYTATGQESYYHISSHYGMIPDEQYQSSFALSWFNVEVLNDGLLDINPIINVSIFDPEQTLIFDETITGQTIPAGEKDTIDIIENAFELGLDPMLGEYTVVYTASIQGQEDLELTSNSQTGNFFVTDYTYSRDANNVSGSTGPGMWLSGGNDGDMIGTDYLFLYEDEITSMDIYIASTSTPGTAFIARIMKFEADTESWVDLTTSTLITVEEAHLGTWVNVTFIDPVFVTFENDEDAKSIKAAIEFYYNGEDNDLWIGRDDSNNHSFWGASWFFTEGTNANQWFSITNWNASGLCIRLNIGEDDNSVLDNQQSNISVYPNPTSGTLNIENAKDAQIEVINLMGQVLYSTSAYSDIQSIDISDLPNGNYFVRIIDGIDVYTQKINVQK